MSVPRVSVVMPLYNKAAYVRRALGSVLAQTLGDFELIVVDDGSTDGSREAVSAYHDPRVRIMAQSNKGPGPARNRGIAEARADYLAFLDADDEWLPSYLEKSLNCFELHGSSVASVSFCYLEGAQAASAVPLWKRRQLHDGMFRLDRATSPLFAVYLLAYLHPGSTVVRAAKARLWGGFFDRQRCLYGEDSYFWLKILLNEAVAVVLSPLCYYHTEASDLSQRFSGPRPIEPILMFPEDIEAACPAELKDLLAKVLAIRAVKTACMLSYWGQWQAARRLLNAFCTGVKWRPPRFELAQLCATPAGAALGASYRLACKQLASWDVNGHGKTPNHSPVKSLMPW